MEPYGKKDAIKQLPESSSRRRINHALAAKLAMTGGHRIKEESIGSISASFSRTTDDATSPEPNDDATSPELPYDDDSILDAIFECDEWPQIQIIDPLPMWKSRRWRIVKHVIVATLRFRGLARPLRSMGSLLTGESSGIVYKVVDVQSGRTFCRVVNRSTGQTYSLIEFPYDASRREEIARMLKDLDHPNLVKCHDFAISADRGVISLILDPLDRSADGASITSASDLASAALQLLLGLTYLHRNTIAHGDIKHSNIFFGETGQIKLLYLGKTLSNTPPFTTETGAMHDGFSWDIWSVGLCILKWSKGLSWWHRDVGFNEEIHVSESVPLLLPLDLNSYEGSPMWNRELLRLLISCMHTDVLKRWTAEQLVHHPFFDQFQLKREVQLPLERDAQLPSWMEVQFPLKKEVQLSPLKKEVQLPLERDAQLPSWMEVQFPLKKEVQLSPLKKEVQLSPLKKEKNLFHERGELMSPVKKKPKISMEDEDEDGDGAYGLESPKDPTRGVPHAVPERCTKHCKLFLPDCEFEKDKLVRMWVAEECIELGVTKRMEDVGNLYFDSLVQEEVILPSKFDNLHREMKYKFNTSQVSDELLKPGNYLRIDASNMDEIYKEALHLTWQCKRLDRTFSDALKSLKQLHTLVVHEDCSASISQLPNDIFLGLRLLRTLDMSRTHLSEVPGSIGKLESLRYLDISETPIKRLPESLDRLHCLQTLNLKACVGISALPRGLGRLVNLRHLDIDIVSQLKSMPRGIGNLTELQTLRAFIVGKNDGCGIGELKNMNEITGSFCISRLENVANAKEAKEAALFHKKYIDKLELRWHNCGSDNFQDSAEILESLQPHFDLKELQLTVYGGSKLPRWISNPAYTDLASITLYKCINCDILPSIGELPSLKILHIVDMENVSNIDTLFCRNHETKVVNAFPRLEKLTLDSMPSLEEWTGVEDGDFPCLRHFSIKSCPKLRVLPSLSHLCSLEHLEISHCMQLMSLTEGLLPGSLESLIVRGCPGINERYHKDGGLDWSKIASVGNIWIDLEKISLD